MNIEIAVEREGDGTSLSGMTFRQSLNKFDLMFYFTVLSVGKREDSGSHEVDSGGRNRVRTREVGFLNGDKIDTERMDPGTISRIMVVALSIAMVMPMSMILIAEDPTSAKGVSIKALLF